MRLRTIAVTTALVSFLLSGGAVAEVIRHDVPDSSYLALGADPQYDSVGYISFASGSGSGSGVLIGNDWYLTAAHNVYSNYVANTPGSVRFTVGGNMYLADQIFVHPGYVSGASTNGNDLALVRLSTPVTNVTPASLYTDGNELGEVGTFVGFGTTGNGLTGATVSSSAKRGGTNVLDVTADTFNPAWSSNIVLSDFDNPDSAAYSTWGSATPTALEMLVAVGDSGGGVFVDVGNGPQLAALATFVLTNNDGINYGYGDAMGATRLSGHAEWIAQTMLVPEPTTLSLAGLGLLAAGAECLRRYRRRKN
jgi:hypothetical protein